MPSRDIEVLRAAMCSLVPGGSWGLSSLSSEASRCARIGRRCVHWFQEVHRGLSSLSSEASRCARILWANAVACNRFVAHALHDACASGLLVQSVGPVSKGLAVKTQMSGLSIGGAPKWSAIGRMVIRLNQGRTLRTSLGQSPAGDSVKLAQEGSENLATGRFV